MMSAGPSHARRAISTPHRRRGNAARECASLLADLGHDVVEASPPWKRDDLVPHFMAVWHLGPALSGAPLDLLEPINRALAELAHATSSTELGLAVAALQAHSRTIVAFWDEIDVLLTPTLALPPVHIGWSFEDEDEPLAQFARQILFTPFTPVWNVTGQPAASVPFAEHEGVPIGVQLVGPPGGEEVLLRLAAQLEQARPWRDRVPPALS